MPYYIGDVIQDNRRLIARTPEKFEETGVHVRLKTRVEEIDLTKGAVRLHGGEQVPYDVLVVATGATARVLDIPGVEREGVFILKHLRDAIDIKRYIEEKQCRKALIIGAGFISMEMAEGFSSRGVKTQILYRGDLPVGRWDPEFSRVVLEELEARGVIFETGVTPVAVEEGTEHRLRVLSKDASFEGDIVLFALGVRPDTTLAAHAGIEMGKTGAIAVDNFQRTNREEVYSAGDCCEVYHRISGEWVNIPLGDIANKQGRIAGRNIGGKESSFAGIVGAQSFKVFDLELGATGLDGSAAAKSGFDPVSALIWSAPVARSLNVRKQRLGIKLTADRASGRLLGAQAIGQGGAVGRINSLSACLWAGMTVDEVGYIDLAYSPPFGGAWDPIHIAAQALLKNM